jgi:hypothetical protein
MPVLADVVSVEKEKAAGEKTLDTYVVGGGAWDAMNVTRTVDTPATSLI